MKFTKLWLKSLGKNPFKLTVKINNVCNSQCKICNIWKNKRTSLPKLNDYDKILKDLSNKITWLSITGGEPFLRDDIDEFVSHFTRRLDKLYYIDLSTNGLTPGRIIEKTKQIVKDNPHKHISLGVSIDSTEERNNLLRGRTDAFQKAVDTYGGLKKIKEKNFSCHINYTLSRHNAGYFEEFLQEMKRYNIRINEINIGLEHGGYFYGNGKAEYNNQIAEEAGKIMRIILRHALINPKFLFQVYFLMRIKAHLDGALKKNCRAGDCSVFIDYDGTIKPCIIWNREIGNLKKGITEKRTLVNPLLMYCSPQYTRPYATVKSINPK